MTSTRLSPPALPFVVVLNPSPTGVTLIRHIPPVVVVVLRGSGIEKRTAIVQPAEVIRQVEQIPTRRNPRVC